MPRRRGYPRRRSYRKFTKRRGFKRTMKPRRRRFYKVTRGGTRI